MVTTLLDLIATNKREDEKTKILYPASEAKINVDTQFALDGFFEEVVIPFNGNPVVYSKNPLDIGATYLADTYDLNVHIPQTFEIQDVSLGDISVIDMPSIADLAEGFYLDIIPCNLYANLDYEFIGLEPCGPVIEQEQNYLEYIQRVTNSKIFDLFTVFNGQKVSDTKLGLIGADALNDHFKVNLKRGAKRVVGEYLETDPLKIIENLSIFKLSYDITVPKTQLGKVASFLEKITGGQSPIGLIPKNAFTIEGDGVSYNEDLFDVTGNGQKETIKDLLNKNDWRPEIKGDVEASLYIGNLAPDPFSGPIIVDDGAFDSEKTYKTATFPIPNSVNTTTGKIVTQSVKYFTGIYYNPIYGTYTTKKDSTDPNIFSSKEDFEIHEDSVGNSSWLNSSSVLDGKSLLGATKEFFSKHKNDPKGQFLDPSRREFQLIQDGKQVTISKGDAVTAFGNWITDGDGLEPVKKGDYFRTWTEYRRYSKLNKAIAHRGLDRGIPSVLKGNGLPNIAPTFRSSNNILMKKYMFSLENLAWNDFIGDLPECEIGAGDVLTSKRGRIMWFPPYDLKFSENVKVSWEDHRFIGRGEPIYTYNNTERSGNLSFNMIVDHPMIVNKIKGERTEIWERYFKGDKSAKKYIDDLIKKTKNIANNVQSAPPITRTNDLMLDPAQATSIAVTNAALTTIGEAEKFVNIYFPNNISDIPIRQGDAEKNIGYQSASQADSIKLKTYYKDKLKYDNANNYKVNDEFFDDDRINEIFTSILEIADNDKATKIYIDFKGYASQAVPNDTTNLALSKKRANNAKEWFSEKLKKYKTDNKVSGDIFVLNPPTALGDKLSKGTGDDVARDSRLAVEARRVEIAVSFETLTPTAPTPATTATVSVDPNLTQVGAAVPPVGAIEVDLLEQLFTVSECDMFEYLEVYDPHTYKTISEKIKYFQPAFHSMTPEGFNGRLNFLHQCTRQSRNIGTDGIDNLTNLSFGRPPICILRIGDFFHTKVVINSLNIDYGDIKWDLNPEGFVAPMIAKITLDFNFIGGQSLTAPINRLQNALSYNFYSSMNMFEKRSDSVVATVSALNHQYDSFSIKEGEKLDTAIGKADYYVDPFTLDDVKMKNQQ